MNRLFFIFVLTISAVIVRGQSHLQYSFYHYTTSNGLVSNQVNSVVQDEYGYIWIGTTDGLQRFDGTRHKVFRHRPGDHRTIPSNNIAQLLIDKKNNLWLLLADGRVGIFNTSNFTFRESKLSPANEISKQTGVKKLFTDEFGNVFYMFFAYELLTWNEIQNEFSPKYNFIKLKKEWGIAGFIQQPGTRKYWISIQGGPLAVYNASSGNLSYYGSNTEREAIIDTLKEPVRPSSLNFDRKGRLWFQTWDGHPQLHSFDMKKNTWFAKNLDFFERLNSYHEIHNFLEQQDGTIWIAGMKVFARLDEKQRNFDFIENGTSYTRNIDYRYSTDMFEDREHNIWLATRNNGILRFNPEQEYFTNIAHIDKRTGDRGDGSPLSYMEGHDGNIWVGVWENGLFHYDKNWNEIPINLKGISEKNRLSVWSMSASKDSNTIWMGAQPGIWRIDQRNHRAVYYNPPILQDKTVRQIAEDKLGNLWIGLQTTGVYKWTPIKNANRFVEGIRKVESIPQLTVNKITIDSKGYIWIASGKHGLYVADPATDQVILHFSNKASGAFRLPEEGVSSVFEYNDSIMVVTTASYILLYNRNTKQTTEIGTPESQSGFISSVQKDKDGYLWVATTNGLYRVNLFLPVFVKYTRDDGIDNEYFVLSSSYAMKDGRLLFGSENQFLVFEPSAIKVPKVNPVVAITDFKVMNRSYSVDSLRKLDKVTLRHDQKSLVIDFSTLTYSITPTVKFMMEGLEKEWQTSIGNYSATYSYLQPGNYTFRAMAFDDDGNPGKQVTELHITVTAPFYKTWWFFSLLILVVSAFLFWLDRERIQRKEALYRMRSEIAGNLHQEINTALSNINILSDMARLKAVKDPEKSKEFIEQIHQRSHQMIIAMDDMLWSINPDNDNMQKTIDRMQEYIDALNHRGDLHIEMQVDDKVKGMKLNMKFRHESFLLFKQFLLSLVNASADFCLIHVMLENSMLVITIDVKNTHKGLRQFADILQSHELKKRLDDIQAKINMDIHKSGTVIVIHIPHT